jgi:cytochrome c553
VPSNVAWTDETIAFAFGGNAFRGLLIARCRNHCDGEKGFSSVSAFPNLAGVDQLSFWKRMQDFRSGKRITPFMEGIANKLSPRDSVELAAYYSMLPTASDPQDSRAFPQAMRAHCVRGLPSASLFSEMASAAFHPVSRAMAPSPT